MIGYIFLLVSVTLGVFPSPSALPYVNQCSCPSSLFKGMSSLGLQASLLHYDFRSWMSLRNISMLYIM